jgi:hypothetical protein
MSKTTTVDLRDLTGRFDAWCTQRGISRSHAMRQLVASAVGNDRQLSMLSPPKSEMRASEWESVRGADSGPPYRFTLRLTHIQRDHLRARAAQAGISCSSYVVAAITACDSDTHTIAGQDAVRALLRSNDLLAQAVRTLGVGRGQREAAATCVAGGLKDPGAAFLDMLRQHLAHAAAVLSDIELTRAGRTPPRRAGKGRADAKSRGAR